MLLHALDEAAVSAPPFVFVEEDQPQHRGVVCSVVRGVRDLAEFRKRASAQLVHDLPGLRIAEVVPLGRLELRECLERRL